MSGIRLLACGSRSWTDRDMVFATLDQLNKTMGISVLIEGCAEGADRFAEEWARSRHVQMEHYPANWKLGKSAGVRRNSRMLADGEPEYVVAFDKGSKGTADMVRKSREWGLVVLVVRVPEVAS